ncbi:hypothetical protein BGZ73_001327 [Actinomortierella ambigua]|nr:hypothetical protein BGZ73_001327 [Actinomortierella ambigua]
MARQAIPKTYMPITEEDLPEKVYEFVQSELDRVARLAKKAVPLLEESGQPGWGKPERAAVVYSPEFARPPTMSISAYIHMLMDHRLIARDLGLEYIHGYEQARFGGGESGESQTTNIPMSAAGGYHRSYGQYRADPSMASHGGGGASMMVVSEQDVIGEDEYRRFMKLLSLILQGLSWSEAT